MERSPTSAQVLRVAQTRPRLWRGRLGLGLGLGLAVWCFILLATGPALHAATCFVSDSLSSQSRYGHTVAVGDWNGDGLPDLAVGAWNDNGPGTDYGRVYIHLGPLDGYERTADAHIVLEPETFQMFGYELAFGDWNGDAYDDLLVGSLDAGTGGEGKAFLFLGGAPSGVFTDLDAYATFDGSEVNGLLGFCVALGDWNGDGFDDALVGAKGQDDANGAAYIFYGGQSGVRSDGNADFTINSTVDGAQLGISCTYGDWNGDGLADALVGARGSTDRSDGGAHLFLGGTAGNSVSSVNADVVFYESEDHYEFGQSVAMGDWDNDGRDDVLIGQPRYNDSAGRAYLFRSTNGTSLRADTSAELTLVGTDSDPGGEFGWSVSMANFDFDNRADLIVSARADGRSCNYDGCGKAYLFLGNQSGTLEDFDAHEWFTGLTPDARFGYDTDFFDIDGDLRADVIIGASRAITATGNSGRVYIFDSDGTCDVFPPSEEICGNFRDDDCDGVIDENCSTSGNEIQIDTNIPEILELQQMPNR